MRDTRHTKVWQKTNQQKASNMYATLSTKIVENGSREVPRGTQNQEKGVLGGTLGPSWGALGTQMGPRCEKDDFFGLSPPSPDPYFSNLFELFRRLFLFPHFF